MNSLSTVSILQSFIDGFPKQGIRIRSQFVKIMQSIFSLRKGFWAEILIFNKPRPKVFESKEFEPFIGSSKNSSTQMTFYQALSKSYVHFKSAFLLRKSTALFRPDETKFEFLAPENLWSNFSENQYLAQKRFLSGKVDCVVSRS